MKYLGVKRHELCNLVQVVQKTEWVDMCVYTNSMSLCHSYMYRQNEKAIVAKVYEYW